MVWRTAAPLRKPLDRLHDLERRLDQCGACADRAVRQRFLAARHNIAALSARLESLSPLGVLARGYSLTTRTDDGRLVENAAELTAGQTVRTRFASGSAISRIEQILSDV